MAGDGAGDPDGKKIARKRMLLGEEALRLVGVLHRYVVECGIDPDGIETIERQLDRQVHADRQRAHGKVESRRRPKGLRSHLAMAGLPRNFLVIDESGKPIPAISSDDSVFVLAGVAMAESDLRLYKRESDKLKLRFLGTTETPFHEPAMRYREGVWFFDGDSKTQRQFDRRLRNLVERTPFVAFAVGIRKGHFAREYLAAGCDPWLPINVYSLAIELLLERYADYLVHAPVAQEGRLVFESQGPKEDAEHQVACARLLLSGTQFVSESVFRSTVAPGCEFLTKRPSHPMELADIVARETYEWVRSGCAVTPKFWSVIRSKFYGRDDMEAGKSGLKVFPDQDIRDAVVRARKGE